MRKSRFLGAAVIVSLSALWIALWIAPSASVAASEVVSVPVSAAAKTSTEPGAISLSAERLQSFAVEQGHVTRDSIAFDRKHLPSGDAVVLRYIANGRDKASVPVPAATTAKLVRDFEEIFPANKRRRLWTAGACGESVTLRWARPREARSHVETLCLDGIPDAQKAPFAKWWRGARAILGV